MKTLIILFMFSFTVLAQEIEKPCSTVPGAPTIEPTVEAVAEHLDPDKNNNTCPNNIYADNFSSATTVDELKTKFNERMNELGITADWNAGSDSASNSSWSAFENTPADLLRAKRLANVTMAALFQYPRGFFRKAGLRTVKMVKDLRVTYEGVAQARMAMPKPNTDTLFYAENDSPGLSSCLEEIEMRMHHELFHLMEGTVHNNNMYGRESSWQSLNPPGFTYKQGGGDAYAGDPGYSDKEHPQGGFSTGYATFGEEEDRSETFAYMMTRGFAQRQAGWAAADPVIGRKVQWIENFMKDKIKEPGMTTAYFDRIESIYPSQRSTSKLSAAARAP